MRIFAVGTKIFGGGGLANIWGGLCPPGPNVEPPLVDGWAVTFGTARRGLGGAAALPNFTYSM